MNPASTIGMFPGANLADQIDTFSAILGIISFVVVACQWLMRGRDREAATRGDLKRVGSLVANALTDQLAQSLTAAERLRLDEAAWLTEDQRDHIHANMLADVSRALDRALVGAGEQAKHVADDLLNGRTGTAESVLEREAKKESAELASEALHLQAAVVSLRDINKAIAACTRAIELAPRDALAWSQLAQLYLRNGELHKAQSAFERALSIKTAVPVQNRIELLDIRNPDFRKQTPNGEAPVAIH